RGGLPTMSISQELERLTELHRDGALSQEEFEAAKARLLRQEGGQGRSGLVALLGWFLEGLVARVLAPLILAALVGAGVAVFTSIEIGIAVFVLIIVCAIAVAFFANGDL
ncbi:MAG: SHOCT domain-containing protein, partial [Pseudomonadota bacterium]